MLANLNEDHRALIKNIREYFEIDILAVNLESMINNSIKTIISLNTDISFKTITEFVEQLKDKIINREHKVKGKITLDVNKLIDDINDSIKSNINKIENKMNNLKNREEGLINIQNKNAKKAERSAIRKIKVELVQLRRYLLGLYLKKKFYEQLFNK